MTFDEYTPAFLAGQEMRCEKRLDCIPTEAMVTETDYIGLVSRRDVDQSSVFEIFFGELQTAPLIKNCPLAMECRLYTVVDTPAHDVFAGEAVATYAAVLATGAA